jgi:hypothetical protein
VSCEWVKDNLFDYIDGELDPVQELVLKKHLHGCAPCRLECEKTLDAWKALDLWEDLPPPGHLRGSILRSIKKGQQARWSKGLLPAAAVFLMALSLGFFLRGTDTKDHRAGTTADNAEPKAPLAYITEENEADIIANLQLLREREFYDSLDKLEKIDYLPLVEDLQDEDNEGQQRSALELSAS